MSSISVSSLVLGSLTVEVEGSDSPLALSVLGTAPASLTIELGTPGPSGVLYATAPLTYDGTTWTVGMDTSYFVRSPAVAAEDGQIPAWDAATSRPVWIDNSARTLFLVGVNKTGATIPKGSAVYVSGGQGAFPIISLAQANSEATSARTIGITTAAIANNAQGNVVVAGLATKLDTSAYPEGQTLYLSPSTPGGFVTSLPTQPLHGVLIGYVTRSNNNNGAIEVHVQNYQELQELSDVLITSKTNGDLLVYNSASGVWVNSSVAAIGLLTTSAAAATYQTIAGMSAYQTVAAMSAYLTTANAASIYQTQAAMSAYLTTSAASATYQTLAGMSAYLTTASASATYYPLTNPSGYITSSALSGYLTTSAAASTYYPLTNPSGYITSSALAGYATEAWVTSQGYLTTAPVTSVAGKTGAVTLTTSDISGLGTMATQTATNYLAKADNLAGLSDTNTARSNLGLGTAAVEPATRLVPAGGTTNQVLIKSSATNYDDAWGTLAVANVSGAAPLASPALTGTPTSTTAAADTNTTQIATTAYVVGQASATTPSALGTAAVGTSLRYARADHVHAHPLPTGGTTGQVLAKVDGANYNVQWTTAGGGGGGGADVQTFGTSTTSGTFTWTKPANAKFVEIFMWGAGGGGGSGACAGTGVTRGGGGGGGGATFTHVRLPAAQLNATESVVVGAGGTGGAVSTTTSGNNGTAGGESTFKNWKAVGGNFGSGSVSGNGTAGAARNSFVFINQSTAGGGGTGASTSGVSGTSQTSIHWLPTGGGGGGGASAGVTAAAGGGSGGLMATALNNSGLNATISGGSGGTVGFVAPTVGVSASNSLQGGTGGGGGFYRTAATGCAGAAGGWPGAGGGGGSGSDTGFNSGAGANGANGYVYIVTYF